MNKSQITEGVSGNKYLEIDIISPKSEEEIIFYYEMCSKIVEEYGSRPDVEGLKKSCYIDEIPVSGKDTGESFIQVSDWEKEEFVKYFLQKEKAFRLYIQI